MPIVRVALDIPLATLFDYKVDEGVQVSIGQRVIVPFGKRQLVGVIMSCVDASEVSAERIKRITHVLHDSAPLSTELLALLYFCSDYYHYPIGQTVLSALPTRLRSDKPIVIKSMLRYRLSSNGATINLENFPKRKVVQRRILSILAVQSCDLAQLKVLSPTVGVQLKALLTEGWVESFEAGTLLNSNDAQIARRHTFNNVHLLTAEQKRAVDAITQANGYECFLLYGITGSGKTEVYVHLMHHVLSRGGQVLLLVPEINLTPQLESYFRSRFFNVNLMSLHSGLSDGERMHHWQQAQSGEAQIVLGTRMAVFAELPNLALIVVDEEHDSSFKQQDGLRYSARDVAIFRAHQSKVPIVLGSATPSLESYSNAQIGRYTLLTLAGRASAAAKLPSVYCININQTVMTQGISERLFSEIEKRIANQEQSLLFINRRGYSPVLMCGGCGWLSECKHCSGKMVLHLKDGKLRCHHCSYQVRLPKKCPNCGGAELYPVGHGTQRVEESLRDRFPSARILRVDRDSTRNKHAWKRMREQIHANEVDVLIGTQMLAKGHDFPALTLVGALNPDSSLYSGDFRAAEKLFAQLMQVAGRSGRADKPGEVVIQTAFPDHPLYRALQCHDFTGFADAQLAERRMAEFPPFAFQTMLRAEGRDESDVYAYLNQAQAAAKALNMAVEVFGVVPAVLARRANYFRAQILVQSKTRRDMQEFLRAWQPGLDHISQSKLRTSLDIDPLEF